MNPIEALVEGFQELVNQVPELVQPLIVMVAGAIPFIEGEVASLVGVLGGVNPIVAGIAAASGNFLCVLLVVVLSSRARTSIVNRRATRAAIDIRDEVGSATTSEPAPLKPESKGRLRFKRWLVRFGVPGASLLGPLAIPTQFTSAILIASGTPRTWVLLWQAMAIVLWTTISTVSAWAALTFLVGM